MLIENYNMFFLAETPSATGDTLMKILGILIGLAFLFLGLRFLFRSVRVIQGIQKAKYHQVAPPRKQEIMVARVIGVLLSLIGLYFTIAAVLSFFPTLTTQ
ncbi:MAG: hypothetical protein PHP61_04965 [Candidatus Izemoplasmatales bacterium]|jgi:uncharacterized membrane protein YphA (DoxX/SURF4 family)|nr:hypothetical protein [Candidatus Izemoplasmatales bacterium]NLF49009.1 hypothetical protein [Acholeplasmataceae bacterium]MDD4355236.1 hypothetical protein [Candidatus Izemoplasmatales bacterium]MDD4987258.1 hypothetical protein [Candidatus Izemoplasmatales bacterium]MDD5601629.1 hypothetical protein [Candidatus Izemoplasmatales bacterium]